MRRAEAEYAPVVELLEQRKWWRDNGNVVHRRRDMSTVHKANTLAWLIRHSQRLAWDYIQLPAFRYAPDDVQAQLDAIAADPLAWMLSRPLVKALLCDLIEVGEVGELAELRYVRF